jgi:hypothetical protein
MLTRFSDHFRLGKSQSELDFVDIPLDADLQLFVDPYALSIMHDQWFSECSGLVVDCFQRVIDGIRSGEHKRAYSILLHLREPNETHLGLSRARPAGRGIGSTQAHQIYLALRQSRAAQSGLLRDLEDCELLIPGISSDKISDITINIVRGKLAEYTETQCALFGIPARRVEGGVRWNPDTGWWENRYANLPIYQGRRILLVPKAAVRRRIACDHQEYYRHFVIEYLQAEHLHANSALVEVLKNGQRRVTKKALNAQHPISKEMLAAFSEQHPEVLDRYKASWPDNVSILNNQEIEERQRDPRPIDIAALPHQLDAIPPGAESASDYHSLMLGVLEALFYPSLYKPRKEQEIDGGRKRIDIEFNNRADRGFFKDLNALHRVPCPYIFVECKNYHTDPANPELDQLAGRFSPTRGKFGILTCRRVTDRQRMLERCRDVLRSDRGYILALDDQDIKSLLNAKVRGHDKGVDSYLDDHLRRLID